MSQTAQARAATYVLTLEEIAKLAEEGGKPAETLMHVVALIAERFHTNVCSAYLLEPDRANLVLAATVGLRPQCIGTLRLALNEGLAGLVAEQVRPVAVEQAQNHPRFKYFREAGEDPYQSFLGVPLIDRGVLQGVLVVQTIEPRVFQEYEIRMLGEAAAQVGPVVSEARTLDRFIAPAQEKLWSLARNVWWSWDNESASLFRDLDPDGLEKMSSCAWQFVDRILTHGNDLCLLMNASVNAYRRLDPHFEAPNQLKASATDRGSMVRIPIGNSRSARVEVRAVAPDANPYLVLYGIFKTGIEGDIAQIDNLRNAPRYLPDNIYDAIENFSKSEWTTKLLGEDVKGRYAELKRAAADRCPRSLGTVVKPPEVQYHHEVYTQYLWNMF